MIEQAYLCQRVLFSLPLKTADSLLINSDLSRAAERQRRGTTAFHSARHSPLSPFKYMSSTLSPFDLFLPFVSAAIMRASPAI